ncbi:MAG: LPXTG cell wall anchor domain-containing protein, partial [Defluviitaleaceae bacterium]|nr:LPXTG cell wall anchor domain-containing protein [Defluviitaleaceae bacterium]
DHDESAQPRPTDLPDRPDWSVIIGGGQEEATTPAPQTTPATTPAPQATTPTPQATTPAPQATTPAPAAETTPAPTPATAVTTPAQPAQTTAPERVNPDTGDNFTMASLYIPALGLVLAGGAAILIRKKLKG